MDNRNVVIASGIGDRRHESTDSFLLLDISIYLQIVIVVRALCNVPAYGQHHYPTPHLYLH